MHTAQSQEKSKDSNNDTFWLGLEERDTRRILSPKEYDSLRRKKWTVEDRKAIAEETNYRCAYCGRPLPKRFALDHMVPLRFGGADDRSNLFAACVQCNHRKGVLTVERFRKAIEDAPRQLTLKYLNARIAEAFGMLQAKPVVFYFETLKKQ